MPLSWQWLENMWRKPLEVVSEIADDVSADAPLIGIGGTLTTIARSDS